MVKHKHAEVIHAWADGAIIQCRWCGSNWETMTATPTWDKEFEYRIKPERVYPETRMLIPDLSEEFTYGGGYKAVANAAIKHALDAGQVMLPGGELTDKDIIKAIQIEEQKRQTFISPLAREIMLSAVKSLLVSEPEIEKLRADRNARDMAIAEAVRDACVATIARFINIPGNLIFVPDLAVVIATVK